MPMPADSRRQKNNEGRCLELLKHAKDEQSVSSWTEWFSGGGSAAESTVTGTLAPSHPSMYAYTKAIVGVAGIGIAMASGLTVPACLAGIAYYGTYATSGWEMLKALIPKSALDALSDYGSSVAEDLIKTGLEYIGSSASTRYSGTQQAVKTEAGLKKDVEELCAGIGSFTIMDQQMDKAQRRALVYCDDANIVARLHVNMEKQADDVLDRIAGLEQKLGILKGQIQGCRSRVLSNFPGVKGRVKDVVKSRDLWHYNYTWGSTLTRFAHCSPEHCFGPGPSAPTSDAS